MVMPRPSLSSLPLPSAGGSRSSAAMSAGRGAVRSSSGGKGFAGVLAGQTPSDHDGADVPSSDQDQPKAAAPHTGGTDGTDRGDRSQGRSSAPAAGAHDDQTASSPADRGDGADRSQKADTSAKAAPHADRQMTGDQSSHDGAASEGLATQSLSLAALMASPQVSMVTMEAGQPQSGPAGGGTATAMPSSSLGQMTGGRSDAGVAALAGLGTVPAGGEASMASAHATASATAISSFSSMEHLSQASAAAGTAGSSAMVSTSDLMRLVSRSGDTASSHGQDTGVRDDVSSRHAAAGRMMDAALLARQSTQVPTMVNAATQGPKDKALSAVQAMNFQSGMAGILSGPSSMAGNTVTASRQGDLRSGPEGQTTDSLFSLMVKASSGESEAFSAGHGDQGASGEGQDMPGHESAGVTGGSGGDGGQEVQGSLSSFAGLVTSSEGHIIQPETRGVTAGVTSHEARQAAAETGLSALQTGGSAVGVLAGRATAGQAGTLTMTVMTADSTPVHVQLDRSAAGLSALSLQGQDDGTTEALQKTHHVLARELDEAGLHASLMKIDVLPADAGHMAGGQEQNMPQHQWQGGHQSSGQQAGAFFSGGEGGSSQEQRSRSGDDVPAPARQEPSLQAEESAVTPATVRPARMGHLNISV